MRELHDKAKNIIQLEPDTEIMLDNVTDLEDETLPYQRSGLHAVLTATKQITKHSNCTAKYWLNLCSNWQKMVDKFIHYGIGEFMK